MTKILVLEMDHVKKSSSNFSRVDVSVRELVNSRVTGHEFASYELRGNTARHGNWDPLSRIATEIGQNEHTVGGKK